MNATLVALICLLGIFFATTLGSSFVYFFRKPYGEKTNSIIVGLASGIMISTSFFGLLLPSLEESKEIYDNFLQILPPVIGFILGALLLYALDKLTPHIHKNVGGEMQEGISNAKLSKKMKFFLAVTLHNIPEGIAVGLICGLAINDFNNATMMAALSLAIGIAIQNLPEGSAVSIPLFGDGMSKTKSFLFGTASGAVEPIFGALALLVSSSLTNAVPYLLSFAAGAMIYVTIDDLIPEFKNGNFGHYGMWSFIIGFTFMMAMEIVM